MRHLIAAAALVMAAASAAIAAPIAISPANPQPDAAALKQGLAVEYAYPGDVKSLRQAEEWLDYGVKKGPPLIGFDYPDTEEGDKTLTSDSAFRVVASIKGFLKFDKSGRYELDFLSNDGLRVRLGGQEITYYDGRHPCENAGVTELQVPSAGWYKLEMLYFQRLGTSCLLAEWTPPGGGLDWVPNENTAYLPE